MPAPHVEMSAAKPSEPTPNNLASGASDTIAQPTMLYATTSAITTVSRMRVRQTTRRPSVNGTSMALEPFARRSWKRPRTLQTSAAEPRNDTALIPKAAPVPMAPTSTPPISGPTVMPRLKAWETRPLAQARSSSEARFGIAACEAGRNGISATVASSARAISIHGLSANTSATKTTAEARSETIITMRRSYVSPSQPPIGVRIPIAANVARNTPDTQTAEFVSS